MTIIDRAGRAGILAACLIAAPASAASCWSDTAADAVRVREFQTMLMVRTLRCKAIGMDISGAFNGFVRTNMTTLDDANRTLRTQLGQDATAGGGAYDNFVTVLANGYGDEATTPAGCAEAAALAARAAAEATAPALLKLAVERVGERALPGTRCADAAPTATAAAVAIAARDVVAPTPTPAPPAAETAPGALPGELMQAMAVLARYGMRAVAGDAPAVQGAAVQGAAVQVAAVQVAPVQAAPVQVAAVQAAVQVAAAR